MILPAEQWQTCYRKSKSELLTEITFNDTEGDSYIVIDLIGDPGGFIEDKTCYKPRIYAVLKTKTPSDLSLGVYRARRIRTSK